MAPTGGGNAGRRRSLRAIPRRSMERRNVNWKRERLLPCARRVKGEGEGGSLAVDRLLHELVRERPAAVPEDLPVHDEGRGGIDAGVEEIADIIEERLALRRGVVNLGDRGPLEVVVLRPVLEELIEVL